MDNYLKILEDSLIKKSRVLDDIVAYNEAQRKAFTESVPDIDSFDQAIQEKDVLIERLTRLDDGFESLYQKVAEELRANRPKYVEQIGRMQMLVTEITEKSMSIQAQEARNKALIESYFQKERQNIRQNRQSAKAVRDYYKRVSGVEFAPSQFMDYKS